MMMTEFTPFTGYILRVESDGFGLVQFDSPIGPCANSIGLISQSTQTEFPFKHTKSTRIKVGMRVEGIALADKRDVAAIKSLTISPSV